MLDQILNIIRDVKSDKIQEISVETSLRDDLNFDSIELAQLTVAIEDQYDVDIFEDGIVSTVGEIISKLKK